MFIVPENHVEKEGNCAKLIVFLALNRKNPQMTIKNGYFHSVVVLPKTITILKKKTDPLRITSQKIGDDEMTSQLAAI